MLINIGAMSDLEKAEEHLTLGRLDQAERIARRILIHENSHALREPERYVQAHEVLARVHIGRKHLSNAVDEWDRAVRLQPTARNLAGLASCLWPTGQYARRAQLLRRAIALDDRSEYHAQLGEMLATLGEWPLCWTEYENRHRMPHYRRATGFTPPDGVPCWGGVLSADPMNGRSIAVLHEGGYGDGIHFLRYCKLLRGMGATRIVFQAPAALLGLVRETGLVDEVVDRDQPLPSTDWYIPLQSLPYAFQTVPATIPWDGPYISGYTGIAPPRGKAVGFVWQGAPHNPTDQVRSANTVEMARFLTGLPRLPIRLVSLQFGSEAERLLAPVSGFHRLEWPRIPTDWRETRDTLKGIDLLISVDTAMVHLAGAMGMPCWMLVAGSNDWRWMLEREDTPWYPSVRLLRMRRPGDWRGLFQVVAHGLVARYG